MDFLVFLWFIIILPFFSVIPRMLFTYTLLLMALSHTGLSSLQDKQTDFGLKVFSQLSKSSKDKNVAMSPYGAVSVLAMAQLGAAGKTLRALNSAMGFSLLGEFCSSRKKTGLRLSLKCWKIIPYKHKNPCFQHVECQDSSVSCSGTFPVRTAWRRPVQWWWRGRWVWRKGTAGPWLRPSRPILTKWTSQNRSRPSTLSMNGCQTTPQVTSLVPNSMFLTLQHLFACNLVLFSPQGTIPEFLTSGSLTDETRLVLLNALSFQALWKVPFDPKLTAERMFSCANGSMVPVHMMTLTNHFQFGKFVDSRKFQCWPVKSYSTNDWTPQGSLWPLKALTMTSSRCHMKARRSPCSWCRPLSLKCPWARWLPTWAARGSTSGGWSCGGSKDNFPCQGGGH